MIGQVPMAQGKNLNEAIDSNKHPTLTFPSVSRYVLLVFTFGLKMHGQYSGRIHQWTCTDLF